VASSFNYAPLLSIIVVLDVLVVSEKIYIVSFKRYILFVVKRLFVLTVVIDGTYLKIKEGYKFRPNTPQ
jgi:hypothetical protein